MIDVTNMFFHSFFKGRKAQGLSLNVIIIAVICIAVLVIILIMLVGKSKVFGSATADCPSKGGSCETGQGMTGSECPEGMTKMFGAKCDTGQVCCTQLDQAAAT